MRNEYDIAILRMLVAGAKMTLEHEMSCDECWQEVDRYAETELAGRPAEEIFPRIEEHLQRCPECSLEFKALMEALRATTPTKVFA